MQLYIAGNKKPATVHRCELVIEGVPTNCDLQLEILSDPRFEAGDYYTDFMEGL